ncbi:efflux RND transporter permease subunit [Mesobacillus selenatarsenatis]|uniref:RND multidrug efflux transporter/Acriflavin resistance protein n=1 Tax=Mesobacillus selenatarsenatis (strain DSM 18680 / JCM 14380 / FERM P-15431 / SF-1) TaxID=1321606 RepID=A0A0A8X807_MESS1|nr:efflux RND transporter permease subunit [Mesobacillus selenatarsenatis]GAM16053.1 RND multidrug efflux transporter/Acriflavin resistance protein [Mesobacillus selenatarsenatis SF-1]
MNLLKFIVQKKILVSLMVVLVLLIGSFSVLKLDKELFPSIKMDGAYVEIYAGEMPAIEVERTITTPLEKKILGIEGVEEILSSSNIGKSSMQLTIERGLGEEVFKEVESVVNSTTSDISGVKDVMTGQFGTSQAYDFFMDVSGSDMEKMTAFAKNILEPRLEALPEVHDVSLSGSLEKEVTVELKRDELLRNGLDAAQVIGAIQQANNEATLGQLNNETNAPSLRWNTQLESVENVKNLQVPAANGFIKLSQIADVNLQPLESSSFVWKNGSKDFIFVQVGRVADATQIEMAEAVREEIKQIREEGLVSGAELNEMVAQADYVKDSIDGVTSNILIGAAIAVAILMLFLRNFRATMIVGLSIPTSVLLTFASMWVFGYSFNMLTLIGLGLGIGMMVDSSIVILESIYRKKELGIKNMEAVIQGTKEVATAVLASMLTTIVVFVPIGLLGGEMGSFMIILSVVVVITLISSVIVSFTLIPSLSEKFLKLKKKEKNNKEGRLVRGYSKMISWTIKKKRHSFAVIGLFFLMLIGSLMLVTKIPMTIMPDMMNRYAELLVTVEPGLSLDEKQEIVSEMNKALDGIKDVESNYVMDNGNMMYTIINMTKGDEITREQKEVNEEILKALRALEEKVPLKSAAAAMSGGGGSPVQINISGESFDELQTIADGFIEELKSIEGIVAVENSIERTSVEQIVQLNESEIEKAGLSQPQIKQFIEQAFLQIPVGELKINEENIPLNVKWDEEMTTKSALLDLKVPTPSGEKKLSEFISLKSVENPNEISHKDGERYISISADIEGKDLGTINREVQKLMDKYDVPEGYSIAPAGDLEQQQEMVQDMVLILAISIFLVYLVMAVQFNHLGHPLIVMSVIPMTIVGVILGLFLTQQELSIMSGMGIIMLIGIVLNNAILLIDRTNQLRNEGYTVQEALVEAGKNRIRPILMTTLTTVGGMLPLAMATGGSGNYQAPMATAIIAGLSFATLITLLLIPAVYHIFTRSAEKRSWFSRKSKQSKKTITAVPEILS